MKKVLLVDGNNLVFRSYFATAYNGNLMKNSKGFPTNALYGFVIMMTKLIKEEKPTHIMVAFDKGKTFRHEMYEDYKKGRSETPDELKVQMKVAKEILEAMNIKWFDSDKYEADDIIGVFSKLCNEENTNGIIISSDRDLLQLITNNVSIKLLKQKDFLYYTHDSFVEEYGFEPIKIIDLKSLQGDSSDNIPGIKGIGEKTALKMIRDYKNLDNVYNNLEDFTPKMKEKLESGKDDAYLSYKLATINTNFDEGYDIESLEKKEIDYEALNEIYEELEFNSLINRGLKKEEEIKYSYLDNDSKLPDDYAIYLEVDNKDYHQSNILGISIYSNEGAYIIKPEDISKYITRINFKNTYDHKKNMYVLKTDKKVELDLMLMAYLLEYNLKDDVDYLANQFGYNIVADKEVKTDLECNQNMLKKAKFIYEYKDILKKELEEEEMYNLYTDIERPLIEVLVDMELEGIKTDVSKLKEMEKELDKKISTLNDKIIELAGVDFNVSSPKQLSEVLFEKLNLKGKKKTKTGYSTNSSVLLKLKDEHEIIPLIIEYRELTKLNSTYVISLQDYIFEDGKIHTIYNQALTRTGRLSSVNPNLQNIPIRHEEGRKIRKAFVKEEGYKLLSADYSQIELRVLAHISKVDELINAFKTGVDIHNEVASKLFGVEESAVDSYMRRIAKAVNFGIVYGISSYGLSENLDIDFSEAKKFIDEYLKKYPDLLNYMDKVREDARELGYVKTIFNRKRTIPEIQNKNYMIRQQGERMALNTPIQGTSADILKIAMIDIHKKFKEKELLSKMILQVHDEIVIKVVDEELELVKKIVKDCMENATLLSVPLIAQICVADNLYDVK